MTRPRNQTRQAQAVQQIIDAAQRVFDAELLREDLAGLFRPQSANAIGGRGVGQKPCFESLVLGHRQLAGPTRLPLGAQGLQAVIAIVVDPALHEPPAAVQDLRDRGSLVAFQRQKHGTVAVSLFGVELLTAVLAE